MKSKTLFILICLFAGAILPACGASQEELDAQATQIAAEVFATQTAEASTTSPHEEDREITPPGEVRAAFPLDQFDRLGGIFFILAGVLVAVAAFIFIAGGVLWWRWREAGVGRPSLPGNDNAKLVPVSTTETIICPTCQKPNDLDARFCGNCGQPLEPDATPRTEPAHRRPRLVAITGASAIVTILIAGLALYWLLGRSDRDTPGSAPDGVVAANIVATVTPNSRPKVTTTSCPRVQPISTPAGELVPFQAVLKDKVRSAGSFFDFGYAVSKEPSDSLIVVYFKGLKQDTRISVRDMDWIIIDATCNELNPIGFGFANEIEPIQMSGQLISGNIFSFSGGANPLIALIFVGPKEIETLTLLDPRRNEHRLSISNGSDWLPMTENYVYGFQADGRIEWAPGGTNWTTQAR